MHFYALEGGIKIKHKIILTLAILFVILLAASTVSAADNVTDEVVGVNDETDFVQINVENQSDETVTIENDEMDSLESTDNDKISDSPGTFTDLSNDIKSGKKLSRDYINTENKEINVLNSYIDGNGHTIDFNNYYTNAFHFTYSSSITIKNCNFVNGTYAVRWDKFSENNVPGTNSTDFYQELRFVSSHYDSYLDEKGIFRLDTGSNESISYTVAKKKDSNTSPTKIFYDVTA